MVKVPGAASVPRVGLRTDPGLEAPEGLFESDLDDALGFLSGLLRAEAERRKEKEDGKKAKATDASEAPETAPERDRPTRNPLDEAFGPAPLPRRKPEPPEAAAGRLRHGAATTARRARAAGGRREMARATQAVLAAPETPASELPGLLKAEADKVLKEGLAEARQSGLSKDELVRLEAELGAQELVLLERGLAEQAARLQAQAEAQLEAEAGELVEALRRDPAQAAAAEAALAELLADFAPGFRAGALEGFGRQVRRRLATAGVEGLLVRGQPEAAQAALDEAEDLPEATQRRLRREIDAQRQRRPREDRALAEALAAQFVADVEAGRPAGPDRLRQIAHLEAPEVLEGLGGELERAAERRRVAKRLAARPRDAWPRVLQEEGLDPTGLDFAAGEPGSEPDPRPARAPQLAQAGSADTGGGETSGGGPFERREAESTLDWMQRLLEALQESESLEQRTPIYEAFFGGLPEDPDRLLALRQGVKPDAHETAEAAPENIQEDYQGMLARGEFSPGEILTPALAGLFFVGPDGRLYWRSDAATDPVPWLFLLREMNLWMRHDQVQDILARRDWPAFLQHLWQQGTLLDLLAESRMPRRGSPEISTGRGRNTDDGPERGGQGDPDAADPEGPSASGPEQAGHRAGAGSTELAVGQPDPVLTDRTVVQPVESRRRLLEMAAQAKPDFDRRLEAIAKAIPGAVADLSRIKEDGPRLTFKINELQGQIRAAGDKPVSPDRGAHLVRDYLAGRLIADNDKALADVLARVRRDFVVVDVKDFMRKPKAGTGYSAIHLQLRHKSGFTMELQVTTPPFKSAADEQRSVFKKYRDFGNNIPDELWPEYQRDQARSREIFDRAWEKWLGAGNFDPRI